MGDRGERRGGGGMREASFSAKYHLDKRRKKYLIYLNPIRFPPFNMRGGGERSLSSCIWVQVCVRVGGKRGRSSCYNSNSGPNLSSGSVLKLQLLLHAASAPSCLHPPPPWLLTPCCASGSCLTMAQGKEHMVAPELRWGPPLMQLLLYGQARAGVTMWSMPWASGARAGLGMDGKQQWGEASNKGAQWRGQVPEGRWWQGVNGGANTRECRYEEVQAHGGGRQEGNKLWGWQQRGKYHGVKGSREQGARVGPLDSPTACPLLLLDPQQWKEGHI